MLSAALIREIGRDVTFTLTSSSPLSSFEANRFRRIISTELELSALSEVTIEENGSDLKEELIAHRLTLIPLKHSLEEVELSLDVVAERDRPIMSSELSGGVAMGGIVICMLRKGKRLKLSAKTAQGTGVEHAKWTPLTNFTYTRADENRFIIYMRTVGTIPTERLISLALELYNRA